jgi:hypothetical protein
MRDNGDFVAIDSARERVRALQRLGWSHRKIAAAAGVSCSTVTDISNKRVAVISRRVHKAIMATGVRKKYVPLR